MNTQHQQYGMDAGGQGNSISLYGKLPAHGDFVHRNISPMAMQAWDGWLQAFIGASQERLGDSWLDIYLTSPIWRFCFSEGVLDESRWAGILLPSVDRVGRYFPFTMLAKIEPDVPLTQVLTRQTSWFSQLEDIALNALENHVNVDDILHSVDNTPPRAASTHQLQGSAHVSAGLVACADDEASSPAAAAMPLLLESFVTTSFASFSYWSTSGSECVAPGMLVCHGLPAVSGATAMLDGDWHHWQWSEPYVWVSE